MIASVLGVGTELTDGQIVNKNASWISARLKAQGVETRLHLVVPDERELIFNSLNQCAQHSDLIFVTGGLGPTSDDFTREVITQWADLPLEFHPPSWDHLSERLTSRGYTVKEIQRQQCYFPRGAEVLFNAHGTANGFSIEHRNKKLFVLPGPPREIESIWQDAIAGWLQKNTQHIDPKVTRMWDTLGVGESDIAMIVEEVLHNINIEKGYRVHLPYVEVKLSYLQSQAEQFAPIVEKITQALAFCTITRDGQDVTQQLTKKVNTVRSLTLIDEVSGQFLLNRLMPTLRPLMSRKEFTFSTSVDLIPQSEVTLALTRVDEHTCRVSLHQLGRNLSVTIQTPYKTMNMHERRLQYFAEQAVIFWSKNLY